MRCGAFHLSYEKIHLLLSMKYWLVYRDPYIGLFESPYNWVVLSHGGFLELFSSIVGPEKLVRFTPKTNMKFETSTVNEDVFRIFRIEHGDFPACHVSFQACNVFEAIYLLYLWKPLMKCHFDYLCTPQHLCNLLIFIDVTDVGLLFRPIYQVTKRSIVRCLKDSLKKGNSSAKKRSSWCVSGAHSAILASKGKLLMSLFWQLRGVGITCFLGVGRWQTSTRLTIMKHVSLKKGDWWYVSVSKNRDFPPKWMVKIMENPIF